MEHFGTTRTWQAVRLLIAAVLCMNLAGWIIFLPRPQEASASASVTISYTGPVLYAGYSTMGMVNQDGSFVYCAQPANSTPAPGSYERKDLAFAFAKPNQDKELRAKMIRAICYFGYGGTGFDASLWPSAWYDGSTMTQDNYFALTHILISDLYAVDAGAAMHGCNAAFRSWCLSQVIGFDDYGNPVNQSGSNKATRWKMRERIDDVPEAFNVYAIATGSGSQVCVSYDKGGWVSIAKSSNNTSVTDGNDCYSLNGASYGVYAADGSKVATLTCGADGKSNTSGYLPVGTYTIREIAAPDGYALSISDVSVKVTNAKTSQVRTTDTPQTAAAELLLSKVDAETEQPFPQAAASFKGARYRVSYFDGYYSSAEECSSSGTPTRSWVFEADEAGQIMLDAEHFVSGDALYTDSSSTTVLPLGTYTFQEVTAPEGYLLDETVYLRQITSDGEEAHVSAFSHVTSPELVKRSDAELTKRNGNTMEGLASIPFLVTSRTTGESHVIVTDENGYWSSSSDFVAHSTNTNGNDAAVSIADDGSATIDEALLSSDAGTWFGMDAEGNCAPVDDARGALPYDTYDVVELACSANEGLQLLSCMLKVSREGYTVDLGTLDDLPAGVTTHARDAASGGSVVFADPASSVIDRIDYTGLVAGQTYTACGTLVNTADGSVIATAEKEFTAQAASGSLEVAFGPFDSTQLGGAVLACTEKVVDAQGRLIAAHEDTGDSAQQVVVAQGQLATSLTCAEDGSKELPNEGWVTITDTVNWRNLVVGQEYELTGRLVHKSNGEALKTAEGKDVTAQAFFTPEQAEGTTTVSFVVDASTLQEGDELVAFEEAYRDGTPVASHADLEATAQTVAVTATPAEDVPDVSKGASMPKTGDPDRRPAAALLGLLALGSVGALAVNHRLRSKRAKLPKE